jgi:hypothetical protein
VDIDESTGKAVKIQNISVDEDSWIAV